MSESPAESPGSQRNEPIFDKYAEDSEERSSRSTNETPNSELSPPDSPAAKSVTLADDKRANARSLAASLPLEEQVGHLQSLRLSWSLWY
jgi:beta-glucosidase